MPFVVPSFTTPTITHTFLCPDGSPASGSVTFRLTQRMSQSGTTIAPGEVTATLDGTGHMSASLYANNDVGTIPQSAQWVVTFRLSGTSSISTEQYAITVPTGAASIDLYALLPQAAIGS